MITAFGLSVRFVSVRASPFVDYHPAPRVRAKVARRRYARPAGHAEPRLSRHARMDAVNLRRRTVAVLLRTGTPEAAFAQKQANRRLAAALYQLRARGPARMIFQGAHV